LHQHLPRTKFDIHIDENSNKPGEQAFEKMISGRYLGEIFRLVIMELIDEGVLFLGQNTYKLEAPYSLDTAFLSLMESSVNLFFPRKRISDYMTGIRRKSYLPSLASLAISTAWRPLLKKGNSSEVWLAWLEKEQQG
jgi:Hexokinase